MVYFVKSELTKSVDSGRDIGDSWLCGGAIVSPTQILTAAACLLEYKKIYAIAGYRRYIRTYDLERDQCTKRWKQRVVKTCVPKAYKFDHSKPIHWLSMDVGVATVEKPYNFSDLTYRLHCHYTPAPVKILYEEVYQAEGIDVLMLGWGHVRARQVHNINDLNSPYLREASGKIQAKSYCRSKLPTQLISEELINKYLICVHNKGKIGGGGELLVRGETNNAECARRNMDPSDPRCANTTLDEYDYYDFRRHSNRTDGFEAKRQLNASFEKFLYTRRQGICQNDHGGPLITWVGKEEVLIGIALTGLLSDTYECIGPFIFTSAYCASHIIQCLLLTDSEERDKMAEEEGYQIEEVEIEWEDLTRNRNTPEPGFKTQQNKPGKQTTHMQQKHAQYVMTKQTKKQPRQKIQPKTQSNVSTGPQSYVRYKQIKPINFEYSKAPPILRNLEPKQNQLYYISAQQQSYVKSQPLAIPPELISQLYVPLEHSNVVSHTRLPWPPEKNIAFNKATDSYYAKIRNVGF
ncbi:hypothetical protein O3G_MSEX006292 [Manduca sexta]|nr:hypothetical protein O3G_MSEX006292 [Manduca sexta]